ncbi:MAG: hypothetical protein IJY10_07645 [Lachnospiraceae bacterium]|nr:hypothetical protein [Lachnospiraceae bacterium]
MERELIFVETLEKVRKIAKDQGNCISEDQIKEAFAQMDLNEEQLEQIYDYLRKHKVSFGEPVDLDEYLTDEEKDYVKEYLDELALLPMVTSGEKEAITLSAMAGDLDAQSKLIEIYLPYVVDVAKLYSGQGVLLEDLIGEGNVALTMGVTMLGCLENAAEAQGMLGKLLMDAMEEYISENAEDEKVDKRIEAKVNKVAEAARALAQDMGRKVTFEELAEETKMSLKAITDAMRLSGFKIEDLESGE